MRDHIRIVSVEGALLRRRRLHQGEELPGAHRRSLIKELERLRGLNGGRELAGLVLDLRNNPGGLLDQAVAVSDRFLPGDLPSSPPAGRDGRHVTEERSKDRDTEKPATRWWCW